MYLQLLKYGRNIFTNPPQIEFPISLRWWLDMSMIENKLSFEAAHIWWSRHLSRIKSEIYSVSNNCCVIKKYRYLHTNYKFLFLWNFNIDIPNVFLGLLKMHDNDVGWFSIEIIHFAHFFLPPIDCLSRYCEGIFHWTIQVMFRKIHTNSSLSLLLYREVKHFCRPLS